MILVQTFIKLEQHCMPSLRMKAKKYFINEEE